MDIPTGRQFRNFVARLVAYVPAIALVLSSCGATYEDPSLSKYNSKKLLEEWRENMKNQNFPVDNDTDYYYPVPKKNSAPANVPQKEIREDCVVMTCEPPAYPAPLKPAKQTPAPYQYAPADNDEGDNNFGRFPKYNPDDDNTYPENYVPTQPAHGKLYRQKRPEYAPLPEDSDDSVGKYPRYNPDDDNAYDYPLYFD